ADHVSRGLYAGSERRAAQHQFTFPDPQEVSQVGVTAGKLRDANWPRPRRQTLAQPSVEFGNVELFTRTGCLRLINQIRAHVSLDSSPYRFRLIRATTALCTS